MNGERLFAEVEAGFRAPTRMIKPLETYDSRKLYHPYPLGLKDKGDLEVAKNQSQQKGCPVGALVREVEMEYKYSMLTQKQRKKNSKNGHNQIFQYSGN